MNPQALKNCLTLELPSLIKAIFTAMVSVSEDQTWIFASFDTLGGEEKKALIQ